MRHLVKHRRAGVVAAAVAAGVLCAASPAAADVTVSPPSAPQGGGTDVTFRVKNTAQSAITRVKLLLPADLPVAEAYPLSVDDWAPQIVNRPLDEPMLGLHGNSQVNEAAAAITWIAMPGRALAPGKSTDLTVAMGPLPAAAQMTFKVEATYADPAKGATMPPVTLTLTPAAPGQEAATHGGGGHSGTNSDSIDPAVVAALLEADDGPGFWSVAGWVAAALAAAGGLIVALRSRRRGEPAAEEPEAKDEEDKELVGAAKAPRVTSWSYRDGPGE
ncbi:DUF1775 domain-containing protein [Actinoplanes sp. NPDC049118]|uniref:DUF1775 domain-containing protein n=1 Tax=Actinoplanes sp. NPDC049118 TaxID=3155769 RepID=UPI0033F7CD5D